MIIIDTSHPVTNKAIRIWGVEGQKAILIEECAECISALARFNRKRTGKLPVAEECADVIVSMMSVIPALDIEEDVKKFIKCKLERLNGINNGEKR